MVDHAAHALARRDAQLNTALHLAVKGVLEGKDARPDTLNILIEHGRAAAVADGEAVDAAAAHTLSVSIENAYGVTPTEIAREAVANV